jgi:uncharacterized phage-associated protein
MAAVIDVAQCILELTGPISSWKLQKLVYYAQAWHCVWEDKPLFDARIEAWANGPVCRELYDRHRGSFVIAAFAGSDCSRLNNDERETVEKVVEYYGKFDGQQLSDLTHAESPWKNARVGLSPSERSNVEITLEAMSEYYGGLTGGQEQSQEAAAN